MKEPDCKRCDNVRMIVVQKYDPTLRIGFRTEAIPCPDCRPIHKPPIPIRDGKMAAAGELL